MELRALSPPTHGAPAETAARRRALTALLRWRLRLLPAAAPLRAVRAGRLLPVLLHASFERARLREEAPGVAGLRYRRIWSTLAREFDLPAPFKAQRAAPLVEAVLLAPAGGALAATVLVAAGLQAGDLAWVEERCEVARAALAVGGTRLAIEVSDAAALTRSPEAAARLVAFGAVAAGRLSAATWAALEAGARRPLEAAAVAALAGSAQGPIAALALALLAAGPARSPLEVAAGLLADGLPARLLADPEELCGRWGASAGGGAALGELLAIARPRGPAPAGDAAAILALGAELALAAARAHRRARRAGLGEPLRRAWGIAMGPGIPRALLPALGARLPAAGPLRTAVTRAGGIHEARLGDGTVVARGATPVQARVRALAILAGAALDPLLAQAEPPWRALAGRLARPRDRTTLLLVVEPAGPSGPPFDPINRGAARAIGFPGALEVRLVPGRRPAGRVLTGDEAVERLVREVQAGSAVEVVPSRSEAHPVAARLSQIVALVRDADAGRPVALEAGGRVLLPRRGLLFRYRLDRFLGRPRTFLPDPDAPDLALSPGERRPVGLSSASVIECRASLVDEARASILYADAAGGWLREVVFLGELEEHLREARAILQQADAASILAVRLSDGVEPALRRAGRPAAPVAFAVRGMLPHDLQVELGGERYGGATSGRSWRDGALALVARWPRTGEGRLSVNAVTVQAGGRRAAGLLALHARSIAVRRLRNLILRTLRSYQLGNSSRSEE